MMVLCGQILTKLAKEVIANNPKQRAKYQAGQLGVLGFFVGQVMAHTKGKANPHMVKDVVEAELASLRPT
eukprot:m.159697 g.159697  ORF g.159697 m.159697 type:complete len:70 (-) comp16351_c0_seq3:119-328(-)